MFFISPQIFQIEYSENMNEMKVCVRPWYLWDVTLVCRDGNYKDWHKYLGTFGSGWHFMTANKCSTACVTPGSKPLTTSSCICHWPTTWWRWSTTRSSPSAAIKQTTRGEKKVWLDFTLVCPPQTISSLSTWPAFGSGGRRCPSCCPSAAMWPQLTYSPGVAQPWDWPYQKWFRIDPKNWWLVEVVMAIASWDLLRSMTQVLICCSGWMM